MVGYWPGDRHRALLHAALDEPEAALAAWERWRASVEFDDLDEPEQRLLPVVYRNLGERLSGDSVEGRMRGIYRLAWTRNQLLAAAAAAAIRALAQAGIPTLSLKGAPLSVLNYRDMGARPMADVDLLVRPAQAAAAMDCLWGGGWRTELNDPKRMIRVHHSYAFSKPPQGEVDLHWFSLWTTSGDAPLWEAAVPLEVGGERTLAPCSADSLLNVCAHGSPRQPTPAFRWIADAVTIVRSDPPDWDRLIAEARRRRLTVAAAATLAYLRAEFSLDVPDGVIVSLGESPAPFWERAAFRAASRERTPWGTLVLIAERHRRMRDLGSEAPWHPGFLAYAASIWDFERPGQVLVYGARRMGRFGLSRVGLGSHSRGHGNGGARSAL